MATEQQAEEPVVPHVDAYLEIAIAAVQDQIANMAAEAHRPFLGTPSAPIHSKPFKERKVFTFL